MKTLRKHLDYPSRNSVISLYHITDIHLGHIGCDEDLLKKTIETIRDDDYAYWGGGGDMADFIPRIGDKRYRETSIAPWLHGVNDIVDMQVERVLEYLAPIAHKCLYLLKGNHEDTMLQYYATDVYKRIVRGIASAGGQEVDGLALGWEGFIHLSTQRRATNSSGNTWALDIYAHHGAGSARKAGGHALRLEEMMLVYDADIVLCGHRHTSQTVTKQTVAPRGNGTRLRTRIGMMCPGLLKSYLPVDDWGIPRDNYPQKVNLPPNSTGVARVLISPMQKTVMLPIQAVIDERADD